MDESLTFQPGDEVVATRTPFPYAGILYLGAVESVKEIRHKIRVRIYFYGRRTYLEFDPSQVWKVAETTRVTD